MGGSRRQQRPSSDFDEESPMRSSPIHVISRSEKKSERLARHLIDQCRQLEPGTLLDSEASMAASFGVGRTTVREALRLLEVNGFVTVKTGAGGGAFVREVSAQDYARMSSMYLQAEGVTVGELTNARDLIEPLIARALAEDLSAEARVKIEQVLREHEQKDATTPQNFLRVSRSMHTVLAASVHNSVLAFFAATVTTLYPDRITYRLYTPRQRKTILAQHRDICESILAGDSGMAEKQMEDHLSHYHTLASTARLSESEVPIEWR